MLLKIGPGDKVWRPDLFIDMTFRHSLGMNLVCFSYRDGRLDLNGNERDPGQWLAKIEW